MQTLRNALNCLVSNGVMHARGGQVRVEVDMDETGSNLKVKVTNRGTTIPEEKISKLLCLEGETTNWDPLNTNSLTIH